MKGVILIVGLCLGQKQKFLPSERLSCSSILNPVLLKIQQSRRDAITATQGGVIPRPIPICGLGRGVGVAVRVPAGGTGRVLETLGAECGGGLGTTPVSCFFFASRVGP